MKTKTRFAPSPTGYLHVGGARTALYSWLYAHKEQGDFVLRIEDTDLERSTPEAVDAILQGMAWLGLTSAEEPVYQTHRFEQYKKHIDQLVTNGKAYRCYASKELLDEIRAEQEANQQIAKYDPEHPRIKAANAAAQESDPFVIRFNNPKDGTVIFEDAIRGTIEIANSQLDDLVIQRTDGSPTYNFCVVIDDWEMGITHVVRGEDHINNTPRQINIYEALGAPIPTFAHCAMILGEDGAKLSKRHGAVSVMQYRDEGYLPQALKNYLVRLGWSHGDQEIFSEQEMIDLFSLKAISRSASTFNPEKLLWLNQHYLKTLDANKVASHLQWHLDAQLIDTSHGPAVTALIPLVAERCQTLKDMAAQVRYFYHDSDDFDPQAAKKHLRPVAQAPLELALQKIEALDNWQIESLHQVIEQVCQELEIGMGKIGMPLRVAVTFTGQSPAVDAVMYHLGKECVIKRIQMALAWIAKRVQQES